MILKNHIVKVVSCTNCPFCRFENHGGGIKGYCTLSNNYKEIDIDDRDDGEITISVSPTWCELREARKSKLTYVFDVK